MIGQDCDECMFSEGRDSNVKQAWMRNMPLGTRHACDARPSRQGNRNHRWDLKPVCPTTYAAFWPFGGHLLTHLGFPHLLLPSRNFINLPNLHPRPFKGKSKPLIHITICSTSGSVSVMSVKAFGITVKLIFAGENQFTYPSTYMFLLFLGVPTLTQMNYLNKAMHEFVASLVWPHTIL